MKKILFPIVFLLCGVTSYSGAYARSGQNIEKIVAKDAKVEKVSAGFSFTEGPAVDKNGRIFFTDQPNDKIYIWEEGKEIREFQVKGERSNGLYFNNEGELVACADYRNKLIKIDMDGKKTVLAEGFEGKHLNGPNDLWIHPNGNIYFTDSYYHRPWWPEGHQQEQDERAVYLLKTTGELSRVAGGYKMPNGIIGSPDGKTLYVADINDNKTWKYTIQADGSLTDKTFFAPEGSDGMTIDNRGNVYLTNDAVSVFSKNGEKLGNIEIPERPANVVLGGKNGNILFVTARTSVYKIDMKVKRAK